MLPRVQKRKVTDTDVFALCQEVGGLARDVSREAMLHNKALALMLKRSRMETEGLRAELARLRMELEEAKGKLAGRE